MRTGVEPPRVASVASLVVLAVALACPGAAQTPETPFRALVAPREVVLDGRLGDPLWRDAPVLDAFTQRLPDEGAPPTERTEVRVIVTPRAIVVGILCLDSRPETISARQLERDGDLTSDDHVAVVLDTYHDRRNAFVFRVNPLGTQVDSLVTNEATTEETEWDGLFTSKASIGPDGWRAELAIPLSTLRYPDGASEMGFNVMRVLRRRQESVLWGSFRREAGPTRISMAGTLTGFTLARRLPLVVKPYLLTGYDENVAQAGGGRRTGARLDAGVDAKVGLSQTLALDLTVNTDFAQAEADTQKVNLTRFPLFYPEKRDFFLERGGFYRFGQKELADFFFSRRIGLSQGGLPIPIDAGVRLTGRAGQTEVGLLAIRQRAAAGEPATDFFVARFKHPIGARSTVGAIVTDREGGPESKPWSRSAGVDLDVKPTETLAFTGFLGFTDDPATHGEAQAYRVSAAFDDGTWNLYTSFKDYGRNLDPGVGFVARTGIRNYYVSGLRRFALASGPVREWSASAAWDYFEDTSGTPVTKVTQLTARADGRDSSYVEARLFEGTWDRLDAPFPIHPGFVVPPGDYLDTRHRVAAATNRSAPLSATATVEWGGFYGGRRDRVNGAVSWRPDPHLFVDLSGEWNDVRLHGGGFDVSLFGLRGTYNVTRDLLFTTFLQVNSASDVTTLNARLRWLWRPGSDVYLVFNQATGAGLEVAAWQLILKATWAIVP